MSTKIEWTDETWNPVTGCTKVSQGCKNCYAERLWPKVEGARVKREGGPARDFTEVRCHPDRLDAPLRWKTPRRIFVNSMSDLFHEDVPDEFVLKIWQVMYDCHAGSTCARPRRADDQSSKHAFQVLTKRADRMQRFVSRLGWEKGRLTFDAVNKYTGLALPNVWLGVSVEDQAAADERIPLLLQTPAAVRWISAEPLLGPISFEGCWIEHPNPAIHENWLEKLDWIVAGGESGPNARPSHPDWFRSLRDQCQAVGVPFFFKQWGEWLSAEVVDGDFLWQDGKRQAVRYGIGPDGGGDGQGFWDQDPRFPCARVGKKAAGRILDGRTHDEYPA